MKISTVLDHIDSGHMALPEFQRGYVWNRDQVRGLFDSLYRQHPVGGLLVWVTQSKTATHRGDGHLAAGVVKLLLDGQQRMTSLYGVVRGEPPRFFDGNVNTFTRLHFHLEEESFEFYQPVKMKDDPLWIDVTELMQKGTPGLGEFFTQLPSQPELAAKVGEHIGRLSWLLAITDIDLHVEEVTGPDKSLDVVVDIFNRVNSGGTKLSKGDLALAKICAEWPEGRDAMKAKLKAWANREYHFDLGWLLRSVNTVLTGEAKFQFLHEKSSDEVQDALNRAANHIDTSLNLIGGRLGLDHDRVFFGRYAVPVMARYLDRRQAKKLGPMDEGERDKLLFWYVQAAMWGRFSGSTETVIDQDLKALEGDGGSLDKLLEQLRLWHGGLRAEPDHFTGWSLGARFYPVLYLLTRMGEARDWGTGLPLTANLLGRMNRLEVHHIPNSLQNPKVLMGVESRRGAVAWALWASLRFLSPLIKPDVRISRIRLPDRLHLKAHGGGPRWTRLCRITPSSPNTTVSGKPGATRRHLMAPDQEMTYSLVRSSSLIPDNQFGSPAPPSP